MKIPLHWLTSDFIDAADGRPRKAVSIQVFRNAWVDRWLARAHPAFPLAFYGPIALFVLAYAAPRISLLSAARAVALGWLGFSLVEYLLHRFAFHRAFPDTLEGRVEAFFTHGYHHAYPNDPGRLVMPAMGSVPLALIVNTAYVLIFGAPVGLCAFAGTLFGYIAYDEIHYLLHHRRPRTAAGMWLRRYHLLHHHAEHPSRFGVSSPLWDYVFGTYGHVGRGATRTRLDGAPPAAHR